MHVHCGLKKEGVEELSKKLAVVLSDTFVLYVKTLNCHWNVEDPRFISLHELFQTQYEALAESVDEWAERMRMIGARAPGALSEYLKHTTLKEIHGKLSGNEMLEELAFSHESAIKELRALIELADKHGDSGLNDLASQKLREHEKTAWFLRSHL